MWISEVGQVIYNLLTNPAFAAVLAASFTGVGVQWISTRGQNRDKDRVLKVDEGTALRIELRAEIDKLRNQLEQKEIDLEKWRDKYYALQERYNEAVNRELIAHAELEEAKEELNKLKPPNGSSKGG
jgi:hypothetical protein